MAGRAELAKETFTKMGLNYGRAEFRPLLCGTLHFRPSQPGGALGTVQDKVGLQGRGKFGTKLSRASPKLVLNLSRTCPEFVLNCPRSPSPSPSGLAWTPMQCPKEQGAEFCTVIRRPAR